MADPLDAFPAVDREADRDLVVRHQEAVRNLDEGGVDGVVYEYRTQFHRDPLVAADETAYFLSVRSHVWDELAMRTGLTEEELERLRSIHAEQFGASVGGEADREALILTKE